jgi:hypothetical protein
MAVVAFAGDGVLRGRRSLETAPRVWSDGLVSLQLLHRTVFDCRSTAGVASDVEAPPVSPSKAAEATCPWSEIGATNLGAPVEAVPTALIIEPHAALTGAAAIESRQSRLSRVNDHAA